MSAAYMRRCARKKRYESRTEAVEARAAVAGKKDGHPVNTYRCDQCLGWHLGNGGGVFISRNRNGKRANKRLRGRI
jgi:hypothetical protein